MSLDQQITEAENAEQAAQRQYAQFESMFLLAQEELRRKRAHLAMLQARRDVLAEIGIITLPTPETINQEEKLCAKTAPPQAAGVKGCLCAESRLQCARCHAWTELHLTEFIDGSVCCRPCSAIIRRANEELEAALKQQRV